jgi:hypothetical protein
MAQMLAKKGQDMQEFEELKESLRMEGLKEYEKFIGDKKRFDSKQMIIDAYESVLTNARGLEKEILNE